MSLETEIQKLTVALEANTAALLGNRGTTTVAPAPAKPKAVKEKPKAEVATPESTEEIELGDAGSTLDEENILEENGGEPVQELEEESSEPLTLDDVRPLLLKIANHKALGNTQAFTLLKRHGASKLTELKAENFEAIRDDAVLMLKKAGVAVK